MYASSGRVFAQRADGSAPPEVLWDQDPGLILTTPRWLPDGERLLLSGRGDILTLSTRDTILEPIVVAPGRQGFPALSPDGSWLAYHSNESGQFEVYVRPFPNTSAGRTQVSIDGGLYPVWASNGRELFYRSLDFEMVAVQLQVQADLQVGEHNVLFDAGLFGPILSIMPDDRYFVATLGSARSDDQLILVQNVFEELKRVVQPN